MDSSKGNKKSTKENPKTNKKGGDADAKKESVESGERKGAESKVDGKKNGKAVDAKKTSPRKDGNQDEHESQNPEDPPEQPNVASQETEELPSCNWLCPSCIEVSRRWPPPPYVDPNPRDPSLLYPGDVDPEFQPSRGDILVIHPGLHMGLADLHRKLPQDGFVSSYDGSPSFEFALGDLVLRMGTYDEVEMPAEPVKKEISKLGNKSAPKKGDGKEGKVKGKIDEDKKQGSSKQKGGKKGKVDEEKLVIEEPEPCPYNPYTKLELYTCSGFIALEEQARLEAERLANKAEKERLENESNKKGAKGKKDNIKSKENAKGDGKKTPRQGPGDKKDIEGSKDKNKGGSKVPALGKEEVEKQLSQEEILVEPGAVIDSWPIPKWRYLGSQMQLNTKSQSLLGKQCPGLTYFYRRYMTAGTRCDIHSLTPLLGEILINIGWLNNWYKNLEKWQKEEKNYKSLVRWFTPGLPSREDLVPGMILLRPLVGREHANWVGWGLDGKKIPPPLLPQPTEEDIIPIEEPNTVAEEENIGPPPKCDCHRKSPCPKPPCPCHLYDPCPKIPNCGCIYCNPLPKKPKPIEPQEKAEHEEEKDEKAGKGKGKSKNGKGKDGKDNKEEQATKGVKKGLKKDASNTKQQDSKGKNKDGKDLKAPAKTSEGKGKDAKGSKANEGGEGHPDQEPELPKKPYVWGAVEMYIYFSKEEGWEYWGRSNRICDTPYPRPSENAKPKFLHLDDRQKEEETIKDKTEKEDDEIGKESMPENQGEKNSKKVLKENVNKKLQQGESVTKNTKKA